MRQRTKKVVSFAVWGDNPMYYKGAIWNAEHLNEFYPGWVGRFYYDDSLPAEAVEKITATGAEMRLMGRTTDVLGMYWRFHPIFDDPTVERVIGRDTDSKFSLREVKMVDEWIASGKPFHIIRDCESHGTQILGGTWGVMPDAIPDFELKMKAWFTNLRPDFKNPRGVFHGSDQIFLGYYIWPLIKNNHVAHVRANMPQLRYMGNEIEVPTPEDGHYVGMVC